HRYWNTARSITTARGSSAALSEPRAQWYVMATIRLIFAIVGLTIPLVAIAGAIRNRDNDRLAEGLLIGMYLGALGSISLLAIVMHFGVL
ncbi:MAG: hypothetical protein WBW37_16635, partial [Methyloceanibacter sp.]